jgi:hypothetical protein
MALKIITIDFDVLLEKSQQPADLYGVRTFLPTSKVRELGIWSQYYSQLTGGDENLVWLLGYYQHLGKSTLPEGWFQHELGVKLTGEKPERLEVELNLEELESQVQQTAGQIKTALKQVFGLSDEDLQKVVFNGKDPANLQDFRELLAKLPLGKVRKVAETVLSGVVLKATGESKNLYAVLVARVPGLKGKIDKLLDRGVLEAELQKAETLEQVEGAIYKALKDTSVDPKVVVELKRIIKQAVPLAGGVKEAVQKLLQEGVQNFDPSKAQKLLEQFTEPKPLGPEPDKEKVVPNENPLVVALQPLLDEFSKQLDEASEKAERPPEDTIEEGQVWA